MKDKEIRFVETLLRSYKGMNAERYNLNIKWSMLERQKNNAIEGQYLSAMNMDGMPGAPRGSYKGSPVLLIRHEEYDDIEHQQSFITERLKDLTDIINIVEGSLNSLNEIDKDIVLSFYREGYSIQKIANRVWLHPTKVKEHKSRAIQELYKSLNCLEGTVIFKAS